MNKFGIVLGVAALATLAGCKDPNFSGRRSQSAYKDVKDAKVVDQAKDPVIDAPKSDEKPAKPPIVVDKTPVVTPTVPDSRPVVTPAEQQTTEYVVQKGDYLAKISKKFNVRLDAIRRANPQLKGDVIRVGQKLVIPCKVDVAAATVKADKVLPSAKERAASKIRSTYVPYQGPVADYTVKKGDYLGLIAQQHKITVRQLKDLNGLSDERIRVGQKLKVPAVATTVVAPAMTKANTVAPKEVKPAIAPVTNAASVAKTVDSKPSAPKEAAPVTTDAKSSVEPKAVEEDLDIAIDDIASEDEIAIENVPVPEVKTYVVKEGEDVTGVALMFGVMQSQIRDLNGMGPNDQLVPGQKIKLPPEAVLQ